MPGPYQTDQNQQYGAGGQYIPLHPPQQAPMTNQMMPPSMMQPMGQDTNPYYGGQQINQEPQINYQNFRTANVQPQQQQVF